MWELALVECSIFTGLVSMVMALLLLWSLWDFIFVDIIIVVCNSGTIAVILGGVTVWSPWLVGSGVHVGCVWDPYLYLDVDIIHFMGYLHCCLVVIIPCVVGLVHTPTCNYVSL